MNNLTYLLLIRYSEQLRLKKVNRKESQIDNGKIVLNLYKR